MRGQEFATLGPPSSVRERHGEHKELLVTHDPRLARQSRLRLWAEHLQRPISEVAGDPAEVIERLWKPIAQEQTDRRKRGERATHRLTMLPGISRRSRLLLGPLQGLVVDA